MPGVGLLLDRKNLDDTNLWRIGKGLVRKVNEDAINLSVNNLYLLADGMGGYDGGQIASSLAVQSAGRFLGSVPAFSEQLLKESFYAANRAILNEKRIIPSFGPWVLPW